MKQAKVTVWKSDQEQTEVHIYQDESAQEYLFGFNPAVMSERHARALLNYLGFEWPADLEADS